MVNKRRMTTITPSDCGSNCHESKGKPGIEFDESLGDSLAVFVFTFIGARKIAVRASTTTFTSLDRTWDAASSPRVPAALVPLTLLGRGKPPTGILVVVA